MLFSFFLAIALETTTIQLGLKKLTVEIADTEDSRSEGLMKRDYLPQDQGMLFVFTEPKILYFWMKETKIPLSIAFFDENRKFINKMDLLPPKEKTTIYPSCQSAKPALYALEVNLGWFEENELTPPAQFSFLNQAHSLQ